ncbi:MAG TPA: NAD(P)-dependent oxidoreductase [Usitatibacter sp.]
MSATVAVAGATGVIGHAIAHRLAAGGHRVRTVGRGEGADVRFDLARDAALDPAALAGCDALVHAAGVTDEDFAQPALAWAKAERGAAALVDAARRAGVRRFAYVSSAHVYGPLEGRIDEARAPVPRSDYARAHLATERIFTEAAAQDCVLIARPCAAYGMPPSLARFARWSLIPFDFPRQSIGGRIVLKSHGGQRRNFVPAEGLGNLVGWWLELATPGVMIANAPGRDEMSVYDFARLCATIGGSATGRPCEVERPPASGPLPEPFEYRTRVGGHLPGPSLEEHVARLVRALLQERAS